jgi:hypothetical protein
MLLIITEQTRVKIDLLADPRESAQDGNNNEYIRNDPTGNNSWMLYGAIPDYVYDLVH